MLKSLTVGLAILMLAMPSVRLLATDYTSAGFIVRDPVVTVGGIRATSTSFEYYSSDGQVVAGEHLSTNFIGREGFLYFPGMSSPRGKG